MPEEIVTQNPDGSGNDNSNPAGDTTNAQPGAKPAGTGGDTGEKKFSYGEDRSAWVDPSKLKHRFAEVEQRTTKALEERHKAEIEARERKIRLLAGVEDVDPQTAEDAKVRKELERILGAGVSKVTPELLQRIERAVQIAEGAEQAQQKVWGDHAEAIIGKVEGDIAEAVGVETLSPSQSRAVRRAYRDAAEEAAWARQNDPDHDARTDFIARHERNDKTLIKEFVDAYVKDWVEPVRRKVASDATSRYRPVPRGERGRPMTSSPVKIDLSKPGAFEEAMAKARAEEGRGYTE